LSDLHTLIHQFTGSNNPHASVKVKVGKTPAATPVLKFEKKENATLQQRIEILDWYHKNGKNQTKTATHFNTIYPNLVLKQPRLSAWLKDEQRWREEYESSSGLSRQNKRVRQTVHPEVTEMMDLWVVRAMRDKITLTGDVLREKWKQFADLVKIPEDERLSLSEGWLHKFKNRNQLKEFKRHGEAGSANPEDIQKERERIQALIKKYGGYPLHNIFNMDETGLFYA
jgi:hypothetical protein